MRIQSVTLQNFRNYLELSLDGMGGLTLFVGANAVGKTNILEGIQLLTSAFSFRHPQVAQLVREGTERGRVTLEASDGNRLRSVALTLEGGKRKYVVNGKGKTAADVRGELPSVMFTPDDLQLVKRSSALKRSALDDLGVQLSRNYSIVRRDFEKTVRFKNRLLREEADQALIESVSETLVKCGAQLFRFRRALFARMVPHIMRVYSELAGNDGEKLTASYRPSWERMDGARTESMPSQDKEQSLDEVSEIMAEALGRCLLEERRRGRCLIGPHNDEIILSLDGRDASVFASQGQQRSIVLAWKLAEVEVTRETLGVSPVLLLDDVLSELDGSRREMLVRFVTEDVQTFVTATDLAGFTDELLDRARVVELPIGAITSDGALSRGRIETSVFPAANLGD